MAKLILDKIAPYSTIIWDWNGTLLNDARIGTEAEGEIFRRYGLPVQTHEERLRNFSMPVEKYYERMGFDFSKVSFDKVAEEWLLVYESLVLKAPLFKGAIEMLERVHQSHRRQFVLSAAPELHLKDVLSKHKIHHYFDAVYGLPDSRADSKIQRGAELMKEFDVDRKSAILIGDTTHDFEVGNALGIEVLLVADGHHAYENLRDIHHNVLESRFACQRA